MKPSIIIRKSLFSVLLSIGLYVLSACSKNTSNPTPQPPVSSDTIAPAAKLFKVDGAIIRDARGEAFIIKGTNVNGPYWPWPRPTVQDVSLIVDTWKCNTVRLNCWQEFSSWNKHNADMDAIIKAFTDRKVVVMIEEHQFTGKYPTPAQLNTLIEWWVNIARKYKNNEYVWFNIMNEPGQGTTAPADWFTSHESVIKAIRKAGAPNIIVCDEHGFGQGNGFASESGSGILSYGPQLTSKYNNLVFSLHLYSTWSYGKDRLSRYADAVQQKNLALIFGEYGAAPDISEEVATSLFTVALQKKIGRLSWHWAGDDIHDMVATGNGGGYEINQVSGAKPSNLSFVGNLVWMDNHGQLNIGDPALSVPSICFFNGDFESGNPQPDKDQIEGWINFGTAVMEKKPEHVYNGSYAVKVKPGEKGGFGTQVYLEPGKKYRLTAWGKHSSSVSSPTTIALKYSTSFGGPESELASLQFSASAGETKTTTFTLPASITSLFLSVWKNDAFPTFWADGFLIESL